ncbi:hypothetical protein Selin_1422 [Desulfurispirillum indicum S5]|uniref:Lipoprotein n=1 Tax=Desulfurispirillum indicum (strain ATCC BAA-1389 / DSM 22839 / S5) TaxID=653733 RepID=E6W6C1_DESIS|nr:hypothetical protein [Desulfurispirillum indicum]ADU66157.1 hypothetical protein Selin_1422 [Desulfurispirillum indicum S5]
MKRVIIVLLTLSSSLALMGCFSPTTHQRQQQQQFAELMQARMQQANQQRFQQQQPPQLQQPESFITEDELMNKINQLPALNKPVTYQIQKAGPIINGSRYLDPEGNIERIRIDNLSGDSTYMIYDGRVATIKFMRAGTGSPPITIATIQRQVNGQQQVTTVTGQRFVGDDVIALSRGFLVTRGGFNGFIYELGKPAISVAIPEDWRITSYQPGEVLETRHLLAHKPDTAQQGSVASVASAVRSFGSTIGVARRDDFALINFDTGAATLININVDALARPLFNQYGNPDYEHIRWRLDWYNTEELGPVLLSREDGTRAFATILNTNEQHVIFERRMGINWMVAKRTPNGGIEVVARLGLQDNVIPDLVSHLQSSSELAAE